MFLSTYGFAAEMEANEKPKEIFSKSSLVKKDAKEDNINVLPFYTVKELKDSTKDKVKINKEEIKTLDQFKVALLDKKKKLEDAESTLKYFQEMYTSNKLDKNRTVLELKWSLRVIAKRKDAIIRLNNKYKQSIDLTALDLDQYQADLDSEKSGKELISNIDNKEDNQKIIEKKKTVVSKKVGPPVTGNIQKDQQVAYKFYKNKTYNDVVNSVVKEKVVKENEKPMEPQQVNPDLKNQSQVVADKVVLSEIPTKKEAVIQDNKGELSISVPPTVIPALKILPEEIKKQQPTAVANPISIEKPVEKVADGLVPMPAQDPIKEKGVNDVVTTPVVLDHKQEKIAIKEEKVEQLVKPKEEVKENSIKAVENNTEAAQLKETLEIVNLKMNQQKIEQEYQQLLEKYKKLEDVAKQKELEKPVDKKEIKKDDSSKKIEEKKNEVIDDSKKLNLTIVEESDVKKQKKPVKEDTTNTQGKVKINSIREQIVGDSMENQITGISDEKDSEDVQYYRGNGIEEEGTLEESDGPAY